MCSNKFASADAAATDKSPTAGAPTAAPPTAAPPTAAPPTAAASTAGANPGTTVARTAVGIIGFGTMGEALAKGLQSAAEGYRLFVVEKQPHRADLAQATYAAGVFAAPEPAFFEACDVVVLAIKPQDFAATAGEFPANAKRARYVSILAGTTMSTLQSVLGSTSIVRAMPNLAAGVGQAVTGIAFPPTIDTDFRQTCLALFATVGSVVEVPERHMPTIVGLSGSGIAFVFEFMHAMAMGGVIGGMPYSQSLEVVQDVMVGAVTALRRSGISPGEMVTRVCSPAGTTIAGIRALHADKVPAAIMNAVEQATVRARALETPNP